MKQGLTDIRALAQKIHDQQEQKRDYIVRANALEMTDDGKLDVGGGVAGHGAHDVNDHTHDQLAAWTGIGGRYYDAMKAQAPKLLQNNVNHWLKASNDTRMVRTFSNGSRTARAFLSDRYAILDNEVIAGHSLEALADLGNIEFASSEITNKRLYIKMIFPWLEGEVSPGDVVKAGVVIANSEVGAGAAYVDLLLWRQVCTNGAIVQTGLRRAHLGGRHEDGMIYAADTQTADARAFGLKVRDMVKLAASKERFSDLLAQMKQANAQKVEAEPVKVIERIGKAYGFNDGERDSILRHLVEGGSLNRWGYVNAVTRTAEDVASYDRATDMERAGGDLITMPQTQFARLAA